MNKIPHTSRQTGVLSLGDGASTVDVTVVGAGRYGALIAGKYGPLVKAVVSPNPPAAPVFQSMRAFRSAAAWRKAFGQPTARDVFDICVHPDRLVGVIADFAAIGAKNVILPKPLALNRADLLSVCKLIRRHRLNVRVASQWHYAPVAREAARYIARNRSAIRRVEIRFARHFSPERRARYSAASAFLPHALQILVDAGLILARSVPAISAWSDDTIMLRYAGAIDVHVTCSLNTRDEAQDLKVFTNDDATPTLVADLTGVRTARGFETTLTVDGKTQVFLGDVLEEMVGATLGSFASKQGDVLTPARHMPVARALVSAGEQSKRTVAVIGAGFFGTLTALELAKRGTPVMLLEKGPEILGGASFLNHCRVHMGYHYPRDADTAVDCIEGRPSFEAIFEPALLPDVKSYYLLAKHGSLTNAVDFKAFCTRMGLPTDEQWPPGIPLVRDHFDCSVAVPERLFDANVSRKILEELLAREPNITLRTDAEVTGLRPNAGGFEVVCGDSTTEVAAVINSTYSNLNSVAAFTGASVEEYQYELCEMPVVRAAWPPAAMTVIDGLFFSVVPYHADGQYLLYDVELSVLERSVGRFPDFKQSKEYLDDPKRRAARFQAFVDKWTPYIENMGECQQLFSHYIVRMVLPNQDETDTRPTIVTQMMPGFWNVFSGKIARSVLTAREVADEVEAYQRRSSTP